jgi:urea carboxylase-associated protein 1
MLHHRLPVLTAIRWRTHDHSHSPFGRFESRIVGACPAAARRAYLPASAAREAGVKDSGQVDGSILEDKVVRPGEPWGRLLQKGQRLRIVDMEGQQAVDFLCYNAADPNDRYNAANTMKLGESIFLGKGSKLWSDRATLLMTILDDTCGRHDTIGGCCSAEMNELRYQARGTRNCRDTFAEALSAFGLGRADIVMNVNFFMHVPVREDGHMAISNGMSKPGDYVDLVAETDVICVLSNCAQRHNPCNGYNPTPVRVIAYGPGSP